MPRFESFEDIYQHIRSQTGCSRKVGRSTARRCFFDSALSLELLGIEASQLQYADTTGEQATNNVMTQGATR